MSAPAPFTVKTPALYVAEPASAGDPMSASVQGHGTGETATVSTVADPSVPHTCEVTASPARTGPLSPTLTAEPATAVHEIPSGDVYAVAVPADIETARYTGGRPAVRSCEL